MISTAPDEYARWVLGNSLITAVILDDVMLYWPCQQIDKWYPDTNGTECYSALPVQFHNGVTWMRGYMNTASGDISLESVIINCTNAVHWYKHADEYYQMRGLDVRAIPMPPLVRLPLRLVNSSVRDLYIPKWDNTWVYNHSMFVQSDTSTGYARLMDERYAWMQDQMYHTSTDSQLRYILDHTGFGALMYGSYGTAYALLKFSWKVGGVLFFYKTFLAGVVSRVFSTKVEEDEDEDPEEDIPMSPVERYREYRKSRGIPRRMRDAVRGL